jgi:hypothetical protein
MFGKLFYRSFLLQQLPAKLALFYTEAGYLHFD